MKSISLLPRWLGFAWVLLLAGILSATAADTAAPPPSAGARFGPSDLEKLAEPIALYPDPLIATILPAAAYPLEIVQAARFVKDTNNLAKLDAQDWDANVKAVARIPQVIQKMDADLNWTTDLGQAFVQQDKELMDAIQRLRGKANAVGALQTTPQQIVVVTNTVIQQTVEQKVVYVTNTIVQIQPSNPQVVYVPTYPPTIYYPPPGYVYNPLQPLVTFGVGVAVGAIIANNCNWSSGGIYVGGGGAVWWGGGGGGNNDVNINVNNNNNINIGNNVNSGNNVGNKVGNKVGDGQKWQPDQSRLQKSGAPSTLANSTARGWNSSSATPAARPSTLPAGSPAANARPATMPAATPGAGAAGNSGFSKPANPPSFSRPATAPAAAPATTRPAARPAVSAPAARPSGGGGAFAGAQGGGNTRAASQRGAVSRGGGGGGGARAGGGRR